MEITGFGLIGYIIALFIILGLIGLVLKVILTIAGKIFEGLFDGCMTLFIGAIMLCVLGSLFFV